MNHKFSKLFNNNAMARIIDVLIEKKDDKAITIPEIVGETNLSRRSVGDGLSLLKELNMVDMDVKHLTKLYKVNKKAKLTKSLISLHGIIELDERRKSTRGTVKEPSSNI